MKQVNNCFGSFDLTLGLSKNQFSCFFHFLREDASSLRTVKAITHIGRQENGTWVLNKETQMAADGEVIPKEDQQYVWLDETFPKKLTKIPLSELTLQVTLPPDSRILSRYRKSSNYGATLIEAPVPNEGSFCALFTSSQFRRCLVIRAIKLLCGTVYLLGATPI